MSTSPNTPILKTQFGSVKPYTRHTKKCKRTDQSCSCPKWLYVNPRGGERERYTLNTPSWAEAVERAADKLKELDPEIAAARAVRAKEEAERKTVYQAINLWLDRTRTKLGEDALIVSKYRSVFGWVDRDGVRRGGMLRYAMAHQLDFIDQFTPLVCQQWLNSPDFPAKADYNKGVVWGVVRSFFNYLLQMGVIDSNPVQNIDRPKSDNNFARTPYTDEQYKKILDQADWYVDERVRNGEREVYRQRMHNFVELLRWTGMDVIDAVQFSPDWIQDTKVDGVIVPVLRYRRTKTSVEAVIPMDSKLAKALRATPMAPKSVNGLPFRYRDNALRSDTHNWGRRIHKLIELAGFGNKLPLMGRDGRPALDKFGVQKTCNPDAKTFRHTFAVGELLKSVAEEVVAKMLGHVDTTMIRKHYAPWCKRRDEAHIRAVITSRGVQSKKKGSR